MLRGIHVMCFLLHINNFPLRTLPRSKQHRPVLTVSDAPNVIDECNSSSKCKFIPGLFPQSVCRKHFSVLFRLELARLTVLPLAYCKVLFRNRITGCSRKFVFTIQIIKNIF